MSYLVAGALALGVAGHKLDELAPALVLAATAADPESLLLRQHLLRDRPFGPPFPMIDDWLDKYDLFKGRACFAGVIKAVLELGKWAGQHSRSNANGITGILGSPLCGGNQVTIVGAGFGSIKTPIVSCPPCLPAGKNRISVAGPPAIHTFRFTPSQVAPGGQPVLSWNVATATSVQIAGISGNGPALALPSPLPTAGSITLAPVGGLVPVSGRYRLAASNGCGTKVADAEFTMTRTPTLSILRIEAVQGIQKVDTSVRLTANRRTAVRVFVDSGITDGFNLGVGANRVGGMVGTMYAENVTTGARGTAAQHGPSTVRRRRCRIATCSAIR